MTNSNGKETGGSAFPHIGIGTDVEGMTLRDYFAAKAMQSLLLAPEMEHKYVDDDGFEIDEPEPGNIRTWYPHTKFFAEDCYSIADEMLKVRNV